MRHERQITSIWGYERINLPSEMTYIRSRLRMARMQDTSTFINRKKLGTIPRHPGSAILSDLLFPLKY